MARKIGLALGSLHLAAFLFLVAYIHHSSDPQAALLWALFSITDFPLSLLYYFHVPSQEGYSGFARFLYLPYLIHGLLGTIWWYFLPRLVTARRLGGIW